MTNPAAGATTRKHGRLHLLVAIALALSLFAATIAGNAFAKGQVRAAKKQGFAGRKTSSRWHKPRYNPTPSPSPAPAPAPTPTPAPSPAPTPAPAPQPEPAPAPAPAPEPAPAPAPAPSPEPAPSSADLLFSGSHIKDFAQLQAAPNAITEVSDPLGSKENVLKMTVSDKDVYPLTPTENPRAQALSPSLIKSGDELWLSTKFMLPQNFPSSVSGWLSLIEIYGPPFNGSSPWQIGIDGNQLDWQRNGSYNWDIPWQAPLVRGQWIHLLLHERFASNGWVEMWINGTPVKFFSGGTYNPGKVAQTEHLSMKTMDASNNGGANSAKIMNYREAGMFDSASVYFGPLKLGSTRASVES